MARGKAQPTDRLSQVVGNLYSLLKQDNKNTKVLFSALKKRVGDLADEVGDLDQLELVLITILDDALNFSVWKDFNWVWYEYTRDSLEVPEGAWKYALWSYRNPKNAKLQESVNYWLGEWMDAASISDPKGIERARNGLENLWMTHHDVATLGEKW